MGNFRDMNFTAMSVSREGSIYLSGYFSGTTNIENVDLTYRGGTDILTAKYDSSGNLVWAFAAGGAGSDVAYSSANRRNEGIYLAGWFGNPATFGDINLVGSGSQGNFLALLNNQGEVQWAKTVSFESPLRAVTIDSDDNIVVFHIYGLLEKYTANGDLLWSKRIIGRLPGTGFDTAQIRAATTDRFGNIYVTGIIEHPGAQFDTVQLRPSGSGDAFVGKYSPAGTLLWIRQLGSNSSQGGQEYGIDLAINDSDQVMAIGQLVESEFNPYTYLITYGTEGSVFTSNRLSAAGLALVKDTRSSGFYLAGTFQGSLSVGATNIIQSYGGKDIFLARLDSVGVPVWLISGGSSTNESFNNLDIDEHGNVYILGSSLEGTRFGDIVLPPGPAASANWPGLFLLKIAAPYPPSITSQPRSLQVSSGQSAVFSATVSATPGISYQWFRGGTIVPGANQALLELTNVQPAQAGDYLVLASNRFGVSTSSVARLTVLFPPPTIVNQPVSQDAFAGSDVLFSVSANGGLPLAYQWQKNGIDLSAATNRVLQLLNVTSNNAGSYSVRITNTAGTTLSSSAQLSVGNSVGPLVRVYLNDQILTGTNYSFTGSGTIGLQSPLGGSIFYTLDGSEPDFTSREYFGPFLISGNPVLRATAYDPSFRQLAQSEPITFTVGATRSITVVNRGGGAVALSPEPGPYPLNSSVTLTAQPDPGWVFLQWLGDVFGTNNPITTQLNRSKTVEAIFGTTLSVTVAGEGEVQVRPAWPIYPFGMEVKLQAVPASGNGFVRWGNDGVGSNSILTLQITNANPVVSALFGPLAGNQYSLAVAADGFGTVTVQPPLARFSPGSSVLIMAIPEVGQTFLSWSGDAANEQNPLPVSMTRSKTIVANFSRRPTIPTQTLVNEDGDTLFRLTLMGGLGEVFQIQSSSNLLQWFPLQTVTNVFGATQFEDFSVTNASRRYYRAVVVP